MMRILVWSAIGILGLMWIARRAWNDWLWQQLQQRYPYAIRPIVPPFPILLGNICNAIYSNIVQGFFIQLIIMKLWEVFHRGWHWCWKKKNAGWPTTSSPRHRTTTATTGRGGEASRNDPISTAYVAASVALKEEERQEPDEPLVVDDTDSMYVQVPNTTPPVVPRHQHHHHNAMRHTKKSLMAFKPTVVIFEEETTTQDAVCTRPSSVLRRRPTAAATNRSQTVRSTKSVAFATDASGAVTTIEHQYDSTPVPEKENSRLAPVPHTRTSTTLGIHASHQTLGHRQIVRLQNEMSIKRREVLTRKRSVSPSTMMIDTTESVANGRISLAKFKRRPLSATTPKRKQQERLQREMARFDDKRRRVNIQVSFAVSVKPPSGDTSTPQSDPSSTKTTNTKSVSFSVDAASSPPATSVNLGSVATTPSDGFSIPFQATPLSDTQGFAMPLQATPHPKKDNDPPIVSFGTAASNIISTPEVPGKADTATVATPIPSAPKPVDTPHPNQGRKSASFGDALTGDAASTAATTTALPRCAPLSTPAFNFSTSSTPPNTSASTFASSGANTTAIPNQPTKALPVSFGTVPAPSFQFGSTPANTPKPGPVNAVSATTPAIAAAAAAPISTNVSFEGTANTLNPFNSSGVPSSFDSQVSANPTFGSGTGLVNAPVMNPSNPFGTTNAPTQSAAITGSNPFALGSGTSSFGNAAAPVAAFSFGSGTPVNGTTGFGFGGASQTVGSAPFQGAAAATPSFGGPQTNGSNLFGNTGAITTIPTTFGGPTPNATSPFGNTNWNTLCTNPGSSVSFGGGAPVSVGATGSSKPRGRTLRRMKG